MNKPTKTIASIATAALALAPMQAQATYFPHMTIVHPLTPISSSTSGEWGATGAALTGAFIGFLAAIVVIHEIKKKRCNLSHDTYIDTKHDLNPTPKLWTDPCAKVKPLAVRG